MTWDEYGRQLSALSRRLSAKIDRGKAIQLSAEELDLLVVCGAYEAVVVAAAKERRKLSIARLGLPEEAKESIASM